MALKPKKEQEKEFLEFLSNYKGLISKVSGIYCHHPEERKDLIQEIVIQLWKAFPKYDQKFSIATWTYRIAINVSISYLRKSTSRQRTFENYRNEVDWLEFDPPPKNERLETLYHFIDQLKPVDKAIIMLYLEEHSNKEFESYRLYFYFSISPDLPVFENQKKLSRLKKLEIFDTYSLLVIIPLSALPFVIVLAKGLANWNLYQYGTQWMIGFSIGSVVVAIILVVILRLFPNKKLKEAISFIDSLQE